MESIKEDLLKCIYSYFDLKENCKYLIYFTTTKQQQQQDLTCSCTNGINVWNINLTNDIFSSNDKKTTTTLNEHLINLNLKLKRNDYELNKIIDTQNLIDLIEFKTNNDNNNSIQFKFKPVKSNENDLKEFLFHMFNRLDKCESELNKLKSNDLTVQSAGNLMQNSEIKHNSNNHQPRRFNLSKNQVANIIAPRQPYMSIINPMTKRRKMPKGVQFDDDDDDEDEDNEEDEVEEEANRIKHVK